MYKKNLKCLKKILSVTLVMGFMLPVILNNKIFAEDKSKLSKEPSETMITPTKFVPRIGDEVSFDINNFGYENQDEKIGSDYGIVFYNYEEINEYDQFAKNNNAMVLQNIDLPNIKVETYGKNEEKWDYKGTDLNLFLHLRSKTTDAGHYITAPNESKEHTIYRKDILDNIKENNKYLGSLMVSKIFFHTLDENGLVIEPGSHPNYNRITSDGPVRVTYKVEDNETKQNYATFQGYSEWYKNDDLSTRQKKEYPNNWLYYETSDIKLELNQEAKEFKAGDKVKLKVTIENKSKNLPNSRLMSGIDFGVKKNNLVDKDDVKADLELSYGTDGTVIPGVLKAGDSKVMETEITLPNEIKEEYLNEDGNIVLTPFLLTSNMDNASGKTIAYKHLNEREYNDALVLDYDENNQGGGDGGSGGGGGSETKNYVILASGDKYTDVLTATVLGNEKKCPILLTDKNKVSDNTLKEIDRLNADKIIISGGPQSVSEKVVEQLENEGHDVRRIAGQNRYETARKIGQEVRLTTKNMDEAVLVDGTNFPDVITMSTLANEKRVPILLTEPKSLNKITEDTLKDWSIDELTIGGEKRSVSQNVEDQVKSKVESVDRIGGHDRYETAYKVADSLREKTNNKKDMILVDGTDFPDGITISSLAAKFKSPILLTTPNNIHPTTAKAINDWTIENILIGGGYNSVSKSIEDKLDIKNKERVAGSNRYNTAVEISKRYTKSTELGKR